MKKYSNKHEYRKENKQVRKYDWLAQFLYVQIRSAEIIAKNTGDQIIDRRLYA